MFRQLLFPGKKPKEIIETGDDDSIDTDTDSGKKKDDGDVKVYFYYLQFRVESINLKYTRSVSHFDKLTLVSAFYIFQRIWSTDCHQCFRKQLNKECRTSRTYKILT